MGRASFHSDHSFAEREAVSGLLKTCNSSLQMAGKLIWALENWCQSGSLEILDLSAQSSHRIYSFAQSTVHGGSTHSNKRLVHQLLENRSSFLKKTGG